VFENLLAQDAAKSLLLADLQGRNSSAAAAPALPHSILLSGPPASGKMTAALEIARVLSCANSSKPGAWNCTCSSCARHRLLAHPDLLLLGPCTFPEEIDAALDLYKRAPAKASAFFFARSVRKIEKRFDEALYDGEENRLSKALPFIRDIEEGLEAFAPAWGPSEGQDEKAAKAQLKAAADIVKSAGKLEALIPDSTPIYWIRSAEVWAQLAPNGRIKTIIIEEADRMNDAARNALLKILEEPPESVEFILVSSRKSAMIGTILSRVRPYEFRGRDKAGNDLVLERIFKSPRTKETAGTETVESFLAAHRAFPPKAAREAARQFLATAFAARADSLIDPGLSQMASYFGAQSAAGNGAALSALDSATKSFGQKDDSFAASFPAFLGALCELLEISLRQPGTGTAGTLLLEKWAALIRDSRIQYEAYNRSPSLLAESLLYAMEEA